MDPSEARFTGTFQPVSANTTIAAVTTCAADASFGCAQSNGVLVYPQGVGSTTVTVDGAAGTSSVFPVSVAETNVDIVLQNLSAASMVCLGYTTSGGQTGSITSFTPVTGASSNPTLRFINVPAPVGVTFSAFRAVVNPPNDGMSGCNGGGIAQSTLSGFSLTPGTMNQETITVSPTSQ